MSLRIRNGSLYTPNIQGLQKIIDFFNLFDFKGTKNWVFCLFICFETKSWFSQWYFFVKLLMKMPNFFAKFSSKRFWIWKRCWIFLLVNKTSWEKTKHKIKWKTFVKQAEKNSNKKNFETIWELLQFSFSVKLHKFKEEFNFQFDGKFWKTQPVFNVILSRFCEWK